MRRLIAIIGLMALALPAQAANCQTVEVSHHVDGSGYTQTDIKQTGSAPDGLRVGTAGYFLWVGWGDPEDTYDDNVSVDISDPTITAALVCDDGTVTLERASVSEPADPVGADPAEPVTDEPEVIDLPLRFPIIPAGVFVY